MAMHLDVQKVGDVAMPMRIVLSDDAGNRLYFAGGLGSNEIEILRQANQIADRIAKMFSCERPTVTASIMITNPIYSNRKKTRRSRQPA